MTTSSPKSPARLDRGLEEVARTWVAVDEPPGDMRTAHLLVRALWGELEEYRRVLRSYATPAEEPAPVHDGQTSIEEFLGGEA